MSHAVRVPPVGFDGPQGTHIVAVPAATDNLVWVWWRGDRAWVVDGPSAHEVLPALDALGLRLEGVLVTHGHGDHVGVVHDLRRRGLLAGVEVVAPAAGEVDLGGAPTHVVAEGAQIEVLGVRVTVWDTPGHHAWHVTYLAGDPVSAVFCGDTLFAGGCGRPFHDAGALFASLSRLKALPHGAKVCCAHEYTQDNLAFARWADPDDDAVRRRAEDVAAIRAEGRCTLPSTLGDELATNPFLRAPDEARFRALRAAKDRAAHKNR